MPGFLDRDPRGSNWADSFDTAAAASLYWKQVPVVLRLHDREEHACDLTVRIFSGTSHGGHAYRVSAELGTRKDAQQAAQTNALQDIRSSTWARLSVKARSWQEQCFTCTLCSPSWSAGKRRDVAHPEVCQPHWAS